MENIKSYYSNLQSNLLANIFKTNIFKYQTMTMKINKHGDMHK